MGYFKIFSVISSWFNGFFFKDYNDDFDEDDYKDNYLAQQLIDLEYANIQENETTEENNILQLPTDTFCFERTGVITLKSNDYVLIDGMYYFDTSNSSHDYNINDQVLYVACRDPGDAITVVKILENKGSYWGEEDKNEEKKLQITDHILVGEVNYREDRYVYIKESDLKFNLDNVKGTFIPIKGDWLEMKCKIHIDDNKPSDISMKQVLSVISFKALRSKATTTYITNWFGSYGICDKLIYIDKNNCVLNSFELQVGHKVLVEAVESNQNSCTWRATKIIDVINNPSESVQNRCEDSLVTLLLEKEKDILVTYPLKFDQMHLNQNSEIILNIKNNSNETYILNKWTMLSRKKDSQIIIKPFLAQPIKLAPQKCISFTVRCTPKLLGKTKECLILSFRGFQIKRFIEINVEHDSLIKRLGNKTLDNNSEQLKRMNEIRNCNKSFIQGIKPVKPASFYSVNLKEFPIPENIWKVTLRETEYAINKVDFSENVEQIKRYLPCLSIPLCWANYVDKWHTLLFMEEIQLNINARVYDNPKVFLLRYQEYLCVEIKGLTERKPTLSIGDRAIITDRWVNNSPQYEGYIHSIKGDLILMKFNKMFHDTYNGSDVSIEFHFSRTKFKRAHQAVSYAISKLGANVLFPSCISVQETQLPKEKTETIQWWNKNLNHCQKRAILNALLGETRPMPYCIFGPPGTGKTVTVIELILQILTNMPESRILVATPSNSAANLVTERMLQYENKSIGSVIRVIAHHLIDSDNIPNTIKPFCATIDIAKENSQKCTHIIKNGINENCPRSFIERHRVIIGTCSCLGNLIYLGLPKGHFTHVIVDEAAQCTEPEIMIAMTFIDKHSGQIILSGDTMQLGPTVCSRFCKELGMAESYMSRILECYPYQKDYSAFPNGYDNRFLTKLNDDYRSLEEVITLPSEMFYDASLVSKINRNQQWISKTINATCDIFGIDNAVGGGIFVYGVRGENARAEDSPSWYNIHEASMVAFTTSKFLKRDIGIDEIGIIAPYAAQVQYLKLLFDAMGLPRPKIGSVEEFQGQERPVILISTVRSSESSLQEDVKYSLGFLKDPKRLNVALTRAQVSVIIFCNPHLLCTDPLWKRVIVNAVKEGKYRGCDLPDLNI